MKISYYYVNLEARLEFLVLSVEQYRPTSTVLFSKEVPVLEILDIIFGSELRRRLMVRQMSRDELFLKYQPELRLKIHNEINLKNGIALLDKSKAEPEKYLKKEV